MVSEAYIERVRKQAVTGTESQRRHAQEALEILGVPESAPAGSGGSAPGGPTQQPVVAPQNQKERHIQRLLDQANTGTIDEKKWALEALKMNGVQVVITPGNAAERGPSQTSPGLKHYEISAPKNLITEAEAKALIELSGGDPSDYVRPKFYDAWHLARDIAINQAPRDMDPQAFDKMFGQGAYEKTLKQVKGNIRLKSGTWVDPGWITSLPKEERRYLEERGFNGYVGTFYAEDPITNTQYRKADILPWAKRTQYGHPAGEIDWGKLNYDMAQAETWAVLEKGHIRSTKDNKIQEIAARYNYAAPATNAISDTLREYRRLSDKEKAILQGRVEFADLSGIGGLIEYGRAQTTRQELGNKVLTHYADDAGNVNVAQMAVDTLKGGGNEKAVRSVLEASGYSKDDIGKITGYAKEYVKQSRPKSYGQQVLSNLDLMGRIIVPGYDLARNWDNYSRNERVGYALIDALTLLPIIGAAGKAGSVAGKTAAAGSRLKRGAVAARNIGRLGYETVSIPVDLSRRGLKGLATSVRYPKRAAGELGQAVKQLGSMGIYPIIEPKKTAVGVGAVLSGKVDLPSGWLLGEGAQALAVTHMVKLQMKNGEEVVWTGFKLGNQPLLGKATKTGKWRLGSPKDLGIDINDLDSGATGWTAGKKLEAKILNPGVLEEAGISPEAARMIKVYQEAAKATGRVKPKHIEKTIPLKGVAHLDADGVQVVLDKIADEGGGVIYGSFITEKQLHPDIKPIARQPRDIDIMTDWGLGKTKRVAQELVDSLQKLHGKGKFRVNPSRKTLIEAKIRGEWRHCVDLHAKPETEVLLGSEVKTNWGWGQRLDIKPPEVFKTQSGLKIRGQSIAEQIRRKGEASTRILKGGKVGPPERRAKDPGDWRLYLASVAKEKGVNKEKVEKLIKEIEDYFGLDPLALKTEGVKRGLGGVSEFTNEDNRHLYETLIKGKRLSTDPPDIRSLSTEKFNDTKYDFILKGQAIDKKGTIATHSGVYLGNFTPTKEPIVLYGEEMKELFSHFELGDNIAGFAMDWEIQPYPGAKPVKQPVIVTAEKPNPELYWHEYAHHKLGHTAPKLRDLMWSREGIARKLTGKQSLASLISQELAADAYMLDKLGNKPIVRQEVAARGAIINALSQAMDYYEGGKFLDDVLPEVKKWADRYGYNPDIVQAGIDDYMVGPPDINTPFLTERSAKQAANVASEYLLEIPSSKLTKAAIEDIAHQAISAGLAGQAIARGIYIPPSTAGRSEGSSGAVGSAGRSIGPGRRSSTIEKPGKKSEISPGKKPGGEEKTSIDIILPEDNKGPGPPLAEPKPSRPVYSGSRSPGGGGGKDGGGHGGGGGKDGGDKDSGGKRGGSQVIKAGSARKGGRREKRGEPGKVLYRRGEVNTHAGRVGVFIEAIHDGTMIDKGKGGVRVHVGKPPAGIKKTTGTPQETLTVVGGPPPKELNVKVGFFTDKVINGRRIEFDKSGLKIQGRIVRPSKAKQITSRKGKGRPRGRVI